MTKADLWDIFTSKQEYSFTNFDEYGRFAFKHTVPNIPSTPLVSDFLFQNGFRPRYPKNKSFAVAVSHDIDHLFLPNFNVKGRIRQGLKESLKFNFDRALRYLNPNDRINPYYNIDKILKSENKLDIKSSFYFLSLKPGERDFNFSTDEITDAFDLIGQNGSEVGLHGGHDAFIDFNRLQQEKNDLEKSAKIIIKGYRNHYLKFRTPDTWNILEKAGFSYDTTYGFHDHPGFRNGMCYPFFPFDLTQDKFLNILEIPLMMMDASFIFYLKWDPDKIIEFGKKLIDQVRAVNGVITILWHNNYYVKPWDRVVAALLEHAAKNEAWFCSGKELNNWWRLNKFCEQYAQFGLAPGSHE